MFRLQHLQSILLKAGQSIVSCLLSSDSKHVHSKSSIWFCTSPDLNSTRANKSRSKKVQMWPSLQSGTRHMPSISRPFVGSNLSKAHCLYRFLDFGNNMKDRNSWRSQTQQPGIKKMRPSQDIAEMFLCPARICHFHTWELLFPCHWDQCTAFPIWSPMLLLSWWKNLTRTAPNLKLSVISSSTQRTNIMTIITIINFINKLSTSIIHNIVPVYSLWCKKSTHNTRLSIALAISQLLPKTYSLTGIIKWHLRIPTSTYTYTNLPVLSYA